MQATQSSAKIYIDSKVLDSAAKRARQSVPLVRSIVFVVSLEERSERGEWDGSYEGGAFIDF